MMERTEQGKLASYGICSQTNKQAQKMSRINDRTLANAPREMQNLV